MCGPGDKMRIVRTFSIFVYFSAKTDPEVLGRAKTETEFKIPQPPNTTMYSKLFSTDSTTFEASCNQLNEG